MQLLDLSEPEIHSTKISDGTNPNNRLSYENKCIDLCNPNVNRYITKDLTDLSLPNITHLIYCIVDSNITNVMYRFM